MRRAGGQMGRRADLRGAGTTLVEIVVVLGILGILMSVSAVALTSLRPPTGEERARRLEEARRNAIRTGEAVVFDDDSLGDVRLLPDGRAIGSGIDPLTGALVHDAR
jgi:type II secretory pathway pseudopilin PulG